MLLDDWARALSEELGVDPPVDVRLLLDVARVAAHSVDRPAAPLTTFVVGWAAAQQGATPEAVAAACARASALAERWAPAPPATEGPGTPGP